MAEDDLVPVARYELTYEAHLAVGHLEAEGIRAMLSDAPGAADRKWLAVGTEGAVHLLVLRADAPRAREILGRTAADAGEEPA